MSGHPTTDAAGNDFTPSASFAVDGGQRDIVVVFVGDSFVAGIGDPKAQGWVGRVLGRTPLGDASLAFYNLGVRGATSADVAERWKSEGPSRWGDAAERRLVVQVGHADLQAGTSLARHRLNLANILDEASSRGIATFVVGPPPGADPATDEQVRQLSEAQRDVCDRRGVPFIDTCTPLAGHEQWSSDLATSRDGTHPGQAGYGLLAWLVLHHGWSEWMRLG
ncbi:GDSL-type esterase/lipase family protein [Janibacter alkaliphilus]|uniref:Lysophospholipase L1-like esterase n=1 Tax=Janibacter alkaliphilus TaxID=1069963 RepID=A0A852XG62_9MICO|nr:lysophospholipase L1-like esterase [Janibacter alkaliphilus]